MTSRERPKQTTRYGDATILVKCNEVVFRCFGIGARHRATINCQKCPHDDTHGEIIQCTFRGYKNKYHQHKKKKHPNTKDNYTQIDFLIKDLLVVYNIGSSLEISFSKNLIKNYSNCIQIINGQIFIPTTSGEFVLVK